MQAAQPRVTPEILATMVKLLPTIGSLRDLCGITGLRLDVVRREMAPFLAIMKLQGTHPQCGCGKDRFHPYGCVDSYAKAKHQNEVPGHSPDQHAAILARRSQVISMLVAGDRFADINAAMGFKHKDARKYLRFLTPEQMAQRHAAIERHKQAGSDEPAATRTFTGPPRPPVRRSRRVQPPHPARAPHQRLQHPANRRRT